jgi:hypothetical protein
VVDALLGAIAAFVVKAINALIAALASVIAALFSALPDMPQLPDPPAALVTAEGWVAWVFPVGTLISILEFVLAMWLIWQIVVIALRWAKASGE